MLRSRPTWVHSASLKFLGALPSLIPQRSTALKLAAAAPELNSSHSILLFTFQHDAYNLADHRQGSSVGRHGSVHVLQFAAGLLVPATAMVGNSGSGFAIAWLLLAAVGRHAWCWQGAEHHCVFKEEISSVYAHQAINTRCSIDTHRSWQLGTQLRLQL